MFQVTNALTFSRSLRNAMLNALKTIPTAPLMGNPLVRLYAGPQIPQVDSVVSDFTASAFSGYADQAVTLTAAGNLTPDIQEVHGTANFTATSTASFTVGTADGYLLLDSTGATYLAGERFSATVNFGLNGDFLEVDLIVPLQGTQPGQQT